MNDLRKRLGIDDWLEIVKEDRVCNGAYISFAQYMYLLEQENKKYKEVIDKLKKYLIDTIPDNIELADYSIKRVKDILKEVEHEQKDKNE